MNSCVQCGSSIPNGQNTCSMCYGDIDHGSDGYYGQWAENEQRQQDESRAERGCRFLERARPRHPPEVTDEN